ncbi:DUF427 domain-containing protein [Croceitalea rosinachiae]|uniref:DUF427 domain-containing protein n=1 Tax=Croceitalea rosinachiae TaxID=3075596 RepID=A0ABU3A7G4_9FLAO|nr:DUF427 domain-containing protein [Croceitalea sp. F388]MDT0606109.1 DUF427 domain-containing protein [Croceitalea sp. F388]
MGNKEKKVPDWLIKARNKWQFKGQNRPSFAQEPENGQVSVWDFPRPPALEKVHQEIAVYSDKICVAKTTNANAVMETAHPPSYYLPPADVNQNQLVPLPNKKSLCEWKGSAKYWALKTDPSRAIAWSYDNPFSEFKAIKGHFAFYPQYFDCFVDGEKARPQPGQFYAGWITDNLAGPFKGEPGTGFW